MLVHGLSGGVSVPQRNSIEYLPVGIRGTGRSALAPDVSELLKQRRYELERVRDDGVVGSQSDRSVELHVHVHNWFLTAHPLFLLRKDFAKMLEVGPGRIGRGEPAD